MSKIQSRGEIIYRRLIQTRDSFTSLPGYTLIKLVKEDRGNFPKSVGKYRHHNDEIVIIKRLKFIFKNVVYHLSHNETAVLRVLNKYQSTLRIRLPRILEVLEKNQERNIVFDLLPGKPLALYSEKTKLAAFDTVRSYFFDMSKKFSDSDIKSIPKRSAWQILVIFPFYLLQAIIKDRNNWKNYFRLAKLFYQYSRPRFLFQPEYILAHRDLTSINILKHGNKLGIVDFEAAIIAEAETDIALFPRYYYREIELSAIIHYLKQSLKSVKSLANFMRLSIFYTIHSIATETRKSPTYLEATGYIKPLLNNISPELLNSPASISEWVNKIILNLLGLIHKFHKPAENGTPLGTLVESLRNKTYSTLYGIIHCSAGNTAIPRSNTTASSSVNIPHLKILGNACLSLILGREFIL